MNMNAEKMITVLSSAIDQKCAEIQKAKQTKTETGLFVLLCIAVLTVPTAFVFWGLSLLTPLISVLFISTCLLLLSPILVYQQGGHLYEQA